ncbi:PREDICTED: transcriptional adapter 2-alpha-like isoform X1 [Nicrophorus vespilloides]|uniref:Transcriptional adapter 2-alpha-like isoform X1 n=1 Tax=Nicrophorus vespilloides TaxID=110193 RepID=A0ABM1MT69_NICVS|nr:PREDICTED: transcriptional adapter 2-alpha-like isoform X1 [Nicrophorus vespilloides]
MNVHNTNTDLTEEDAADLQFPKDECFTAFYKCVKCDTELFDTFILCVQCDFNLCTKCFANGAEVGPHRNDHNYKVMSNEFELFKSSDWTAKEEMILLNGILTLSNFSKITTLLPNKSFKDIKKHYDYYYLMRKGSDQLPKVQIDDHVMQPVVPYRFRLNNVQDPIRSRDSAPAGYNAARSDFEFDFDKNAEDTISTLELFDSEHKFYDIASDLQKAIVNAYRRKVWERQRRKNIIREHGLIMQQKTTSWLHRYDMTITPPIYEKLIRFMQFFNGRGFEYLMEGLHRAGELKIQIARLCEFRKQGITTLDEAQLYVKLKNLREDSVKEIKRYQQIAELNIKYKNIPVPINICPVKRRSRTPLEIIGMPGYEKLLQTERDLCRNIRLPPLNYLELKAVLIAENNKMGHLKLLTARRLLKIDVNKTRKLYDFLIQEGYVKKPKE